MLDEQRIELAKKIVEVAAADVKAAKARLEEAQSILGKYQAEADRWDTEVKRLTREVSRGVVDAQVLLESTNQFRSSARRATPRGRASGRRRRRSSPSRPSSPRPRSTSASPAPTWRWRPASAKRIEAWVGYITLAAPFDGVIVARNANTFDFVQPGTGDPTADPRSPYRSPSGNSAPIYVVDRTDIVRIFVDIPEQDANYVMSGPRPPCWSRAIRDEPIKGTVTRTSWALNVKSRTLRAEIDLPNPDSKFLPGMYAYANVVIERPGVRAVPMTATAHSGDKTFCWMYQDGNAKRTEVRTGVSDGEYIEIVSQHSGRPHELQGRQTLESDQRLGAGHRRRPDRPDRRGTGRRSQSPGENQRTREDDHGPHPRAVAVAQPCDDEVRGLFPVPVTIDDSRRNITARWSVARQAEFLRERDRRCRPLIACLRIRHHIPVRGVKPISPECGRSTGCLRSTRSASRMEHSRPMHVRLAGPGCPVDRYARWGTWPRRRIHSALAARRFSRSGSLSPPVRNDADPAAGPVEPGAAAVAERAGRG